MIRIPLIAVAVLAVVGFVSVARADESDARRARPGTYVVNRPAQLFTRPSADAKILAKLRPKTVIEVTEVQEQWYKIRSETGKAPGWIRRSYADPKGSVARGEPSGTGERRRFKVGTFRLVSPSYVYAQPTTDAKKAGTLKEGQEVRVVDKTGLWYRIESERGDKPPGYVPTEAAKRASDAPTSGERGGRKTPDRYEDPNFDPRK